MYPNHMTEKSEKREDSQKSSTISSSSLKRGRGRPKGAKNKPKSLFVVTVAPTTAKRRGRPKGAKNKPKLVGDVELVKFKPNHEEPTQPKKRGRPCKPISSAVDAEDKEQKPNSLDALEDHPLNLAAKWLEKNMHPNEMQYYRTRANKNSVSLRYLMVSDMLGFFNVQNADICKQIKKNNFIDRVCNS